ncbi:MAG: hypothetical protein ABL986_05195 [Vicinamibacterales bacterium]
MSSRSLLVAMLCAAAVTAEFVGGKATRDALFLTSLHVTALPTMLIVTGLFSILLVTVHSRTAGRVSPATLVPASFVASGLLFVVEWLLRPAAPAATAVMVYLHVSGAGPLLASGFWLIVSERFDPRTAKARFGQIAGAGTIGGLLGALLSERVAAELGTPPMLLFLGALQFVAAWLVWVLADRQRVATPTSESATPRVPALSSGPRAIAEAPHLRHLTALVLLGTTSAALLEYLFKTRAVFTFGPGDGLLRFFALYYASTSLISFVLQVVGSTAILRRFGLGMTTSSPSIALLAGSLGGLVAPGFGSLVVARAGESILRGSWFRAGYEQFFTPMSSEEKRTAKPFIDVAIDRMGDAVGGGIIRLVVVFVPLAQYSVILSVAMACSVGAILAASHLNRWYLRTLEKSLVNQGGDIDLGYTKDGATARVVATFRRREARRQQGSLTSATTGSGGSVMTPGNPVALAARAEADDILVLRLGSRERVIEVLSKRDGLLPGLVPHVIPLLAWDSVADYAVFALRKVAEERIGELTDSMLNPAIDVAIRLRLARVFSVCVSQRAADGLMLALDDERPAVRFQAARSLVAIVEKNARVHIDRARIEEVVLREVATGPNLVHVFALLSLILPREPLQIAFRSLNSEDGRLRGTALEYLEEVLPMPIRQALWSFLVTERSQALAPVASVRR